MDLASAGTGAFVVLLGTAAGRTSYRGVQAAGISSALVVNGQVYLVDFGAGWLRRYFQAGLGAPSPARGLESLRAAFITHLHADHVVDYPSLILFGATDGLSERKGPLPVLGPGPRGKLPPATGRIRTESDIVAASNPTPGTEAMTEGIYGAFATDINDNILDSGKPNPHTRIKPQDIALPPGIVLDPNRDPAPEMEPFEIYRDENVCVSAILVNHAPVFPSFAFRFDTRNGSVVFSGDTNVNNNLRRIAQDADILVNEVIDTKWAQSWYPKPWSEAAAAKVHHLLSAHTPVEEVGPLAESAKVRMLVLTHLAPADSSPERWKEARNGFSGTLVVGKDLQWIPVRSSAGRSSSKCTSWSGN